MLSTACDSVILLILCVIFYMIGTVCECVLFILYVIFDMTGVLQGVV